MASHRFTAFSLLLALGSLAVCSASAQSSPLPRKPPQSDRAVCGHGPVRSRPLWFRATDGTVLAGAVYGSGRRGVVLAPESTGSHCGWLSFAGTLAAAGYRVLAYDERGLGQSPPLGRDATARYDHDVVGAVRELHRLGATRVVAAGASLGGAALLRAGPELTGLVRGLVDFSGESYLAGAENVLPQIRLPLLVVGGRTDPLADAQASRQVLDEVASKDRQILLYPGAWHGWDLVETAPTAPRARTAILAWLGRHLGPR